MLTFDFDFLLRCQDSAMPFQPQKMKISHVLIVNTLKRNYFTDFTIQCCPELSSILSAQFLRCVYMQMMLLFKCCCVKKKIRRNCPTYTVEFVLLITCKPFVDGPWMICVVY